MSTTKNILYIVDSLERAAKSAPYSREVQLALEYLHLRLPRTSVNWDLFLSVKDAVESYLRYLHIDLDGVLIAIGQLRTGLEITPETPITVAKTRTEMQAVADMLGVSTDWHEPDEQEVAVFVTSGNLDCSGYELEKQVVFYKEGQPVAQASMALILAWATDRASKETDL